MNSTSKTLSVIRHISNYDRFLKWIKCFFVTHFFFVPVATHFRVPNTLIPSWTFSSRDELLLFTRVTQEIHLFISTIYSLLPSCEGIGAGTILLQKHWVWLDILQNMIEILRVSQILFCYTLFLVIIANNFKVPNTHMNFSVKRWTFPAEVVILMLTKINVVLRWNKCDFVSFNHLPKLESY